MSYANALATESCSSVLGKISKSVFNPCEGHAGQESKSLCLFHNDQFFFVFLVSWKSCCLANPPPTSEVDPGTGSFRGWDPGCRRLGVNVRASGATGSRGLRTCQVQGRTRKMESPARRPVSTPLSERPPPSHVHAPYTAREFFKVCGPLSAWGSADRILGLPPSVGVDWNSEDLSHCGDEEVWTSRALGSLRGDARDAQNSHSHND